MKGVMYDSNFLSTSRDPVETSQQLQLTPGGSPVATVLAGHLVTVSPNGNYLGGTGNVFTLQMPEKYYACVRVSANALPLTNSSGTVTIYNAIVTGNYSTATGQISVALCTNTAGVLSGVAVATPCVVYFNASFETRKRP